MPSAMRVRRSLRSAIPTAEGCTVPAAIAAPERESGGKDDGPAPEFAPAFLNRDDD